MKLYIVVIVLANITCVAALLTAAQQLVFTKAGNDWTITVDGDDYKFVHTGVVDTNTYTVGTFPAAGNHNRISAQNYQIYVPKNPALSGSTTCTSLGYIAMAVNGATLFNPLNAEGEDAVSGDCAEIFDTCQGHPDQNGRYHYHQAPSCVSPATNEAIGIALDGFLIYNNKDENGNALASSALDECGGRTGTAGDYRYHMQSSYPYIIGCFKGSFSSRQTVMTNCKALVSCSSGATVPIIELKVKVLVIATTLFVSLFH